jgi:hypothetical protein
LRWFGLWTWTVAYCTFLDAQLISFTVAGFSGFSLWLGVGVEVVRWVTWCVGRRVVELPLLPELLSSLYDELP